jgi:4-hydroxy-2-oxoheptanedioate aldolase
MKESAIKTIWNRGNCVLNGWLSMANSFSAEVMANLGWDSLCIDIQHGMMGYETAVLMLQAISTTKVTPIVRVPWNDPAIIMKCLDAGAYGVICPMINTREDAEHFVQACHYPPLGYRSSGPTRAAIYGGKDYRSKANETIVTFAMIETAQALSNLDDILSTPGLDAVYIGPSDLALSLGVSGGLVPTSSAVINAIDKILTACKRHQIRAGVHCGSADNAKDMMAKGFDFVTVLTDLMILSEATASLIAAVKTGTAAAR